MGRREKGKKKNICKRDLRFEDFSSLLRSKLLLGPDSGKALQDTEGVSMAQCS